MTCKKHGHPTKDTKPLIGYYDEAVLEVLRLIVRYPQKEHGCPKHDFVTHAECPDCRLFGHARNLLADV